MANPSKSQLAAKAMANRNRKGGSQATQYYIVIGGFVLVCAAAVIYNVLNPKEMFLEKQVIDHDEFIVHNSQNKNFQQGPNKQFEGQTMNDARLQFNLAIAEQFNFPACEKDDSIDIPMAYDMREDADRKDCVQEPRWTGNCTASHVHAVVSTIEDRMCILSEDNKKFRFSTQDVISCDKKNYYCTGGYVTHALNYGAEFGYISEEAFPWTGENSTCPEEVNSERVNKEQWAVKSYCAAQGAE
jgi:hypothetical protein